MTNGLRVPGSDPPAHTNAAFGDEAPAAPLLEPVDWAWMAAFMAVGLALRLVYFSGFGLGDDFIFRNEVNTILLAKTVLADNQAYRFAWWFPTALSCRFFGLSELGMIFPFPVTATVGTGLLYAFAKALYGRPGALIAASLLLVQPLDFAWSTMFTNDLMVSVLSAATMLCVLRALEADTQVWRRRLWTLAGVGLWLTFHAKISAVFLLPAIAIVCFARRARVTRDIACFALAAGPLFVLTLLMAYAFTGDPLFPYHAELSFQGLVGAVAAGHRLTAGTFWYYPRLLFQRDELGDFLYSVHPHVLLGLAVLAPFLGLRTSWPVFWWFLCVFLGMQLNIQRVDGVWVAGFRNIRHLHVLVYPIILLLAGYLTTLRARWHRLADVVLVAMLVFGAWQSVATASKTQVAFADRRATCRFLATLPRDLIYADQGMVVYCGTMALPGGPLRLQELHPNPEPRQAEIATVKAGYLVTGGAREPYYGCPHCIPVASQLPPGQWRQIYEIPGPAEPAAWRTEPLRVWQAIPPPPP